MNIRWKSLVWKIRLNTHTLIHSNTLIHTIKEYLFFSEPRLKPDQCDKLGRNALHVAAESGQVDAIIKLKQVLLLG